MTAVPSLINLRSSRLTLLRVWARMEENNEGDKRTFRFDIRFYSESRWH
jgi:hypothetical protein